MKPITFQKKSNRTVKFEPEMFPNQPVKEEITLKSLENHDVNKEK